MGGIGGSTLNGMIGKEIATTGYGIQQIADSFTAKKTKSLYDTIGLTNSFDFGGAAGSAGGGNAAGIISAIGGAMGSGQGSGGGGGMAGSLVSLAGNAINQAQTRYTPTLKTAVNSYGNKQFDTSSFENLSNDWYNTKNLNRVTAKDIRPNSWASDIANGFGASGQGFAATGNWIGAVIGGASSNVGSIVGRIRASRQADKLNKFIARTNASLLANKNAASRTVASNQFSNLVSSNINAYGGALDYENNASLRNVMALDSLNINATKAMPNSFTAPNINTPNVNPNNKFVTNKFAEGGMPMEAMQGMMQQEPSMGIDPQSMQMSEFNAGGTHEENPNGGVYIGMGANGKPNMVEEGEVKIDDYVFSNRLKIPKNVKKKYGLSPMKEVSFADGVKKVMRTYKDRPNDPIANNTKKAFLADMQQIQEVERQKKEWNDLAEQAEELGISPQQLLEQQQLAQQQMMEQEQQAQAQAQAQQMQQMPQQEQQPSPEEMAMMQQQMVGGQGQYPQEQGMLTPEETGNAIQQEARQAGVDVNENAYGGNVNRFDRGGRSRFPQIHGNGMMYDPYVNDYLYKSVYGDIPFPKNPKSIPMDNTYGYTNDLPQIKQNQQVRPDGSNYTLPNSAEYLQSLMPMQGKAPSLQVGPVPMSPDRIRSTPLPPIQGKSPSIQTTPLTSDSVTAGQQIQQSEALKQYLEEKDKNKFQGNPYEFDTSMRKAPIYGNILSTILAMRQPDWTSENRMLQAAELAGKPISYDPIGGKLAYNPSDYYTNLARLRESANATREALRHGNRAGADAAILAAGYNENQAQADLMNKLIAADREERLKVANFNSGIDKVNADGAFNAARSNQEARARQASLMTQSAAEHARLKEQRDSDISRSLSNLYNSLGNLGSENYDRNMVNQNRNIYGFNPIKESWEDADSYKQRLASQYQKLTPEQKERFLETLGPQIGEENVKYLQGLN